MMMFILAVLSASVLKLNTIQYMFPVVVSACQRASSERAKRFTKFAQRSTLVVPMVQSNLDFENMAFMANMAN